ncbi:MAG: class II aldolase/adducin family protein, partial [Sphingobacteriia bacterium]|nr:class II aldolase/adducin family protein [Candidatus Fonsibacter lacus]
MGDVMREAHKRGWITTRDGNISLRRDDKFYITPSGVRK